MPSCIDNLTHSILQATVVGFVGIFQQINRSLRRLVR